MSSPRIPTFTVPTFFSHWICTDVELCFDSKINYITLSISRWNFDFKIGSCMSAVTCRPWLFWQKFHRFFRLKVWEKYQEFFYETFFGGSSGHFQWVSIIKMGIPREFPKLVCFGQHGKPCHIRKNHFFQKNPKQGLSLGQMEPRFFESKEKYWKWRNHGEYP